MIDKSDFLKRKAIGLKKAFAYHDVFKGLVPVSDYVPLEQADSVAENIRVNFADLRYDYEMISIKAPSKSAILMALKESAKQSSKCYVFTDDFEYCGMYLSNAHLALDNVFSIAQHDFQGTCFVCEENFSFFLTVNFYDNSHNDYPNSFEIKLKAKQHFLSNKKINS